jgi:hypothetical protein
LARFVAQKEAAMTGLVRWADQTSIDIVRWVGLPLG